MDVRRIFDMHHKTSYARLKSTECKGCWTCVDTCPRGVLGRDPLILHPHSHAIRPDACTGCGACARACPHQAIALLPQTQRLGATQLEPAA